LPVHELSKLNVL